MAAVLTINGVERAMLSGWSFRAGANSRGALQCEIYSAAAAYRPTLDHEVILIDNGVTVFGGYVSSAIEHGVGGETWSDIVTEVSAIDYNSITEHRHIDGTIGDGTFTLKQVLTAIIAILGTGVTLDAAQVDGPVMPVLTYSDVRLDGVLNDLTAITGGWTWAINESKVLRMRDPAVVSAPFNIVGTNSAAIGDVEIEPSMEGYANTIIVKSANFRKFAIDGAEGAAHGAWEAIYTAPDDASETAMQALADSILARSTPMPKRAKYKTLTPGLRPGMAQTINLPNRNVNNTFLIQEVVLQQAEDGIHYYNVTAIEGTVYQTDWRDTYKRWGGSTSGSVAGGVTTGGGGTSSVVKRVYNLGGTGTEFVRSVTPTWVPATGGDATLGKGAVHVQLDTTELGGTTITIKARLRALSAGVTVKARLYNVSDSTAPGGESAVVTNTDWEWVSWTATLTAGQKFYELQLLPGTANEDVAAAGAYAEK